MSNSDFFLKKTLGEDYLESLTKFELYKPGTRTVLDHEEIGTALKIVPKTVLSLLIRELKPMAIGETKDVTLPVPGDAILNVTKHEHDVFSGRIDHENKVVVEFKFRSIPGVGLVIMSAFELYDVDSIKGGSEPASDQDLDRRVQKIIDERLALHDLVGKVVDQKIGQKQAVEQLVLARLTDELSGLKKKAGQVSELVKINQETTPQSDDYFRGMSNGLVVADSVINEKNPVFVEKPVRSPLKDFIDSKRKKKVSKEFKIELAKGETVSCPDCGKNIFSAGSYSGCICLGSDMDSKIYLKKSEGGLRVRFGKGWDAENIEMLLSVLRRKDAESGK